MNDETPRTDEKAKQISKLPTYRWPIEWKLHSRKLERELSAANAKIAELLAAQDECK